jgi:hypothetical protein
MYDEPFKLVTPAVNNGFSFVKYPSEKKLSTLKNFYSIKNFVTL